MRPDVHRRRLTLVADAGNPAGTLPPVESTWHPSRRSVASWAIYDLANTIFALGVGSLYFLSGSPTSVTSFRAG